MMDMLYNNPIYKKHRGLLLCIIDLSIVMLSFLLAYWVKIDFSIPDFKLFNYQKAFIAIIAVLAIYAISFSLFKIHKSLWKYIGPIESLRIGLSVLFSTCILMVCVIVSGIERFYLGITFTAGIISLLVMFNFRLAYRLFRKHLMGSGKEKRKAIIIGAGDAGYILLKELIQNERYDVEIVGFIDDQKVNSVVAGYKVMGDTYDIPKIVEKHGIEIAFIAIPSADKECIRRIFDICQSVKIETKIMKATNSMLEDNLTANKIPLQDISIEDLLGRGEVHLDQEEIKSYITNQVIAITGAGGSIGSELCRQIIKFHPKKLVMIDINENALYMLEQEFNRNKAHGLMESSIDVNSIIASIRDFDSIVDVFNTYSPKIVFHAAAHKHVPLMETRPVEAIKNNVFGTKNVIDACIKCKISRFIMISTDKAVNPTNVMGATKRMTEMILQAYANNGVTKMAAVRFGNVLGSNGSVIPIFKRQIAEGGPVTITDKKIIRYFMTIPEAAQLVLQAGYYADKGEIFVLDMGQPVKILDLAEKMIRLSGYKPYEDIDIIEIGLRPGEKMYEELRLDGEITAKTKNNLIFKNNIMNITKEEINVKLENLRNILDENLDNDTVKNCILEQIKDKI